MASYRIHKNTTTPLFTEYPGVPHVEKVEVGEKKRSCGKECSIADGLTIDVFFYNGARAKIRDYNANFVVDGKDKVERSPDIPKGIKLSEILERTGNSVFLKSFKSRYGATK